MRNPLNFEAEPFEFYSEFDEYEEGQPAKPCRCNRHSTGEAEFFDEYEEEQPDAYSEFDEEMEMLDEYEGQPDAYSETRNPYDLSEEEVIDWLKKRLGLGKPQILKPVIKPYYERVVKPKIEALKKQKKQITAEKVCWIQTVLK